MRAPIRRALLINSQAPGAMHLPGVINDSTECRRYLKSPNGGAFRDDEITTLNNPTVEQVLLEVRRSVVDYFIIFFSGHGYTNVRGERMISLTNGNLRDTDLLNNGTRQLVLIDACRTHERGATMGGMA